MNSDDQREPVGQTEMRGPLGQQEKVGHTVLAPSIKL